MFLSGYNMIPSFNTTLVSHHYPTWIFGQDPHHEIMACAYGDALTKKAGKYTRNLMRDQRHLNVFPEAKLAQDSKE